MIKNIKKASLLDVIVVFVISASIISISSLVLNIFKVHTSVILSLIITLSLFWVRQNEWGIDLKSPHALPIIMLLLIGLLFRSEPYHFIAGGQDQGVYVNMSQYYEKYGKIFIIDELRETLTDSLKSNYDTQNLKTRNNYRVDNQIKSLYLPGVYVTDQQNSEYVFQFYQLHPLWMSIFGKVFGNENRIYSLVFFSLLSLVSFYLLAFEFTKRKDLSFCAGGLLAINPLHTFFSKFPVTEVVALSFTTLSFYYLLKYYNLARDKLYFPVYLILSSLLMSGMFFTRISGFMYIPFFYLILILVHIYINNKLLKRQLKLYVYSVFLLYAVSVWYGLTFSYPYSIDIYSFSFSKVFGERWQERLLLLIAVLVLVYLTLLRFCETVAYREKLQTYLANMRSSIPYLFLIFLVLGFYKVYQLGFTDNYIGNPWYDIQWQAVGKKWEVFFYWSVFVVVEYLSPFIIIVFSYILFSQVKRNDATRSILILFVLLFFIHINILQWFVPYQYYYARYLLSESLPFMLLFTIISLDRIVKYNKIAYLLVGASGLYMLFFTTMQFKGKEMGGMHASLSEINKYVGKDDILIINSPQFYSYEIKTPLKFYYGYNVLTLNNENEIFLDYFCSENKNIYILKSTPRVSYEKVIKIIGVNAEIFKKDSYIPIDVNSYYKEYNLLKVSCSHFKHKQFQQNYTLYERGKPLGEMKNFHGDLVWTKEISSLSKINIEVDQNKYLVLEAYGWNPLRNDINKLNLNIKVNGDMLNMVRQEKNKYYFSLLGKHKISDINILCNSFNPKEMGMSQDNRNLGIDIKSIRLIKEIAQ